MLGLESNPDFGPYEIFCFNEAIYYRALFEEHQARENQGDMTIDDISSSMSGGVSGVIGQFNPAIAEEYLRAGGTLPNRKKQA